MKKKITLFLSCFSLLFLQMACSSPQNNNTVKLSLNGSEYPNGTWTIVTQTYSAENGFKKTSERFPGDSLIKKEVSFKNADFATSTLYFNSKKGKKSWYGQALLYVTGASFASPKLQINAQKDSLVFLPKNAWENSNVSALSFYNTQYAKLIKDLWFKKITFKSAAEVKSFFDDLNKKIATEYAIGDKLSDFLAYKSLIGYMNVCQRAKIDFSKGKKLEDLIQKFDTPYFMFLYGSSQNLAKVVRKLVVSSGDNTADLQQKVIFLLKNIKNEEVRQRMVGFYISKYITAYKSTSQEIYEHDYETIKNLLSNLKDQKSAQKQLKRFEKIKYTFKGSGVPDVTIENIAGKKTSLKALFDGKNYVYIDLWATWCVPCVKEIPYLKKLEKQYKDANIRFISISVDATHKIWLENGIKKYSLHGEQYLDKEAEILKAFNISAIPRFLFYNPDGTRISINAPRPSNPKVKELFAQYLKK